ncbi:MAG TPA: hypothetical protein DCY13_20450 [Verrucomicrobiales bacterium]|nr:hypothetical protein [Verrucomicrobiales bacterium]
MTVLPIVARELRVSARRWGTYVLRLGAAGSAIALATIVFLTSTQGGPPSSLGKVIFTLLSGFVYLYALLIGVRVTSDCISSEKREGTLGLLFLTDLKGYDIVLGKLAASALDSFYALIATLPVLAIPILLGSVTTGELWRTSLALVSTALFSVCAGLFVSTFSVSERKSTSGTFLLILLLTVGVPILLTIWMAYSPPARSLEWLLALSPIASIYAALANTPQVPQHIYWISIGATIGYALVFATTSALAVPGVWQQRVESGRIRLGQPGDDASHRKEREERQQLLDSSPTCWLSGRGRLRGIWLWVFLASVAGCWIWAYVEVGREMLDLGMSFAWMYFVHGVLKVFVASEAVRTYGESQKQDALELLLCTPLSVRDVVNGQQLHIFRYFRWPFLTVLTLDLLLVMVGILDGQGFSSGKRSTVWIILIVIAFFIADCVVLMLVGLWRGLIARNSRQALVSTMARVLLLPWLLFGLAHLLLFFLGKEIGDRASLYLIIALSLLINGIFGWHSWDSIRSHLREIAAARYGGPTPSRFWTWLGRTWGRLTASRKSLHRPTGFSGSP